MGECVWVSVFACVYVFMHTYAMCVCLAASATPGTVVPDLAIHVLMITLKVIASVSHLGGVLAAADEAFVAVDVRGFVASRSTTFGAESAAQKLENTEARDAAITEYLGQTMLMVTFKEQLWTRAVIYFVARYNCRLD